MPTNSRPVDSDVKLTGDSQEHQSSLPGLDPKVAEEVRSAKRKWRAVKLAVWGLGGLGSIFVLIGMFWVGALGLLGASVIWIVWDVWARREQARFDAIAEQIGGK